MRCALALVCLVAFLAGNGVARAQAEPSRAQEPSRFQVSLGGGGIYETFGGIAGSQVSLGHCIAALRVASMMPDDGHGGIDFFQVPNLPREILTDYAVLGGYGWFARSEFAELLVGPSYSIGRLRGAFDSASVYYGGFGSRIDTSARYFEHKDFRNFGFTIECRSGFNLDENAGFGATLFVTRCSSLLYAGFTLDVDVGILQ